MSGRRGMYGIKAVERMTGVSAGTVRAWQERNQIPTPQTGPSGEVLYSRDDVERIMAFAASHSDPEDQAAGKPLHVVEGRDEPRLLVLLAERDPYAADLTEYFLRTEGYGVETIFNPDEALKRFDEVSPDLAIVELLIGGGEGFRLCAELCTRGACPVIAISPLDPGRHPALPPVDALLHKPLQPLDLVSTVKDLLGTSALVRRGTG